jgi:hypothetical protein
MSLPLRLDVHLFASPFLRTDEHSPAGSANGVAPADLGPIEEASGAAGAPETSKIGLTTC